MILGHRQWRTTHWSVALARSECSWGTHCTDNRFAAGFFVVEVRCREDWFDDAQRHHWEGSHRFHQVHFGRSANRTVCGWNECDCMDAFESSDSVEGCRKARCACQHVTLGVGHKINEHKSIAAHNVAMRGTREDCSAQRQVKHWQTSSAKQSENQCVFRTAMVHDVLGKDLAQTQFNDIRHVDVPC